MKKVSIRLDDDLIEQLKEEAKNCGIEHYTTMIRVIIKQHYFTKKIQKELDNLK